MTEQEKAGKAEALIESEAFLGDLAAAGTLEDVQAAFAKNGVDFTLEEVQAIGRGAAEQPEGELDEADLDNVSGGICIRAFQNLMWDPKKGPPKIEQPVAKPGSAAIQNAIILGRKITSKQRGKDLSKNYL